MLFTPKGEGNFVAAFSPGQIFGVVLESMRRSGEKLLELQQHNCLVQKNQHWKRFTAISKGGNSFSEPQSSSQRRFEDTDKIHYNLRQKSWPWDGEGGKSTFVAAGKWRHSWERGSQTEENQLSKRILRERCPSGGIAKGLLLPGEAGEPSSLIPILGREGEKDHFPNRDLQLSSWVL